jgi:hypothetical protein
MLQEPLKKRILKTTSGFKLESADAGAAQSPDFDGTVEVPAEAI